MIDLSELTHFVLAGLIIAAFAIIRTVRHHKSLVRAVVLDSRSHGERRYATRSRH